MRFLFVLVLGLVTLALAGCAYMPAPAPDMPPGVTKHEGSGGDVYPGVERAPSVARTTPVRYKNCAALNAKYPHGVGKAKARDKTTGTPVTTFLRNTKLYLANKGRDRDGDGIACEKA